MKSITNRIRHALARLRTARSQWLYRDDVVKLNDSQVVIRHYYWPFGSKRVPYTSIAGYHRRPLKAWHGQFRVHGIDQKGRWYSRDRHRGEKETAIDLSIGRRIRPVLTPHDVEKVTEILDNQIARAGDPGS